MTKPLIAIVPIDFTPGVRAHNVGDVVPEENVKRNGWEDFVQRAGTKGATAAVETDPADAGPAVVVDAPDDTPTA